MKLRLIFLMFFVTLFFLISGTTVSAVTNITSCTDDITVSGVYEMNTSILSSTHCITISTSDVVFDCKNYLINSSSPDDTASKGIDVSNSSIRLHNVSIYNCWINDFGRGIHLSNITNVSIKNATIWSSRRRGINFINCSSGCSVINVTSDEKDEEDEPYIHFSFDNFKNSSASNLTFIGGAGYAGLHIKGSGDGIVVAMDSNFSVIVGTNRSATFYAIYLNNVSDVIINDSHISSNTYCIFNDESENNTIYNNNFSCANAFTNRKSGFSNTYNITKTLGTNIIGGSYIGGNYWDDYVGNDTSGDDIGDTSHTLATNNVDYLPLILKDYGNLTITTPDGDQNWTYSQSVGTDELFNLTVTTDGNTNSTLNFSLTGIDPTNFTLTITNTSIGPGNTHTILANITSNSSLTSGTYNFNISCNQSEENNVTNISIKATVSAIAGDVDIVETSWAIAKAETDIVKRTFTIANLGNYNLTGCNMTFTNTLSATATFNYSNFNVSTTINKSVLMQVSGGSAGTDNSARVDIICVATASGGTDSDQLTGSLSISATTGGGSGGEPPTVSGDFDVYPSTRIVGVGYPEYLIQPPFTVNVYNGNISQKFYMTFSSEVNPYCDLLEYPEDIIPPGGYCKFVFECEAPNGTEEGHIHIKSVGGSERAIPIMLIGGTGLWEQFNAFFIMFLTGNPIGAIMMNFIIFGWQIPVWAIGVVILLAVVIFLKRGEIT